MGLRERRRGAETEDNIKPSFGCWRQNSTISSKPLQMQSKVRDKRGPRLKMKAAANCARSGPYRFVLLEDLLTGNSNSKPRILCKWMDDVNDPSTRCNNWADVACCACGTEFCMDKVSGHAERHLSAMLEHRINQIGFISQDQSDSVSRSKRKLIISSLT